MLTDELDSRQRAGLHARIGEYLAALPAGERPLSALAYHFAHGAEAGTSAKAAEYALAAADEALGRLAYEDSIEILERALRVLDEEPVPNHALRCDVLVALASVKSQGSRLRGYRCRPAVGTASRR